jgi:tungstate transport system ATP-binding protein
MKRDALPCQTGTQHLLTTLSGVGLQFGTVQALTHLNLSLHRGDRLALVGANGSGKTSLLRLLHGLVAPSTGQRTDHLLVPEQRHAVGAMVFQHPFLLRLTARQNVLLGLWLRGVAKAERAPRCDEALARVGLLGLAQRPARALSGGQQQRLALARAWALLPDVLFLDEPTASLDPSAKREVEALIEQIADHGVTVVMSPHNLGQVKRLATRVVYLDAGRLVVDLPVDTFFHQGLPHDAAAFLKGELPWT